MKKSILIAPYTDRSFVHKAEEFTRKIADHIRGRGITNMLIVHNCHGSTDQPDTEMIVRVILSNAYNIDCIPMLHDFSITRLWTLETFHDLMTHTSCDSALLLGREKDITRILSKTGVMKPRYSRAEVQSKLIAGSFLDLQELLDNRRPSDGFSAKDLDTYVH